MSAQKFVAGLDHVAYWTITGLVGSLGTGTTATEVDLEFNARGRKSPVTIGLYEIKAKNGQYRYENRSGEIVARVNTLTFKKSENPRMDITVASIAKKAGKNGPLGQLKAAIANLFIKPVKIDPVGNETLLHFGYALFEQKPTFTFPKAGNLKEATVLAFARRARAEVKDTTSASRWFFCPYHHPMGTHLTSPLTTPQANGAPAVIVAGIHTGDGTIAEMSRAGWHPSFGQKGPRL
jgi:hypothetical protein